MKRIQILANDVKVIKANKKMDFSIPRLSLIRIGVRLKNQNLVTDSRVLIATKRGDLSCLINDQPKVKQENIRHWVFVQVIITTVLEIRGISENGHEHEMVYWITD